ncbi:nucleoside deaminase [Neobacillus mesonae]|uniref:tRNA-specific adenosine deaminase n=1 Tax=Neobacillus mesonae TaxID=1193713 RepID=A0A3T0HTJ4_9BACI|nr:nucleoside deaminase [Neobacillus mesonae]AZU60371.1 tRNA-specific adenosine deaminase [Neobacillus mesonae]
MKELMFMKIAVDVALENVLTNGGGPFGAVVVRNGQIISVGRNQVTTINDPTAHAEVQAIRAACHYMNDFQLTGCELYTSCEPCPMCLGAIFWARLQKVYYACTKEDAAKIGFDDQFIYSQLDLPPDKRSIPMFRILPDNTYLPFNAWIQKPHKNY